MEALIEMFDAINEGNDARAQEMMDNGLRDLFVYASLGEHGAMILHTNFKVATWLRGIIKEPLCRPPMRKPRKNEVLTLAKLLRNVGYELIDQEKIDAFIATLPR